MKILIAGDFHIPYENEESVKKFFEHSKTIKPDRIIIAGDFIDCSELSKFRKNPITTESFQDEISFGKEYLQRLRKQHPNALIDYIEGNHEFRFKICLMEGIPELFFAFRKDLSELLGCEELDIKWHGVQKNLAKFSHNFEEVDGWLVGHFDRVLKNGGYTARILRDDFGANIIQAHTHRIGSSYRTYHKGIMGGHEIGCMCDINKAFIAYPDWQNGALLLEDGKAYQIVL